MTWKRSAGSCGSGSRRAGSARAEQVGIRVDREHFERVDYERFASRLEDELSVLASLLRRRGFGQGPASLGAELELCLLDANARPLPMNRAVLSQTLDPRVQLELDRFNLEYNAPHVPLAGRPFSALARAFEAGLAAIGEAAREHGGYVSTIGILPTLRAPDLESGAMSDVPRFRALAASLRRLRRAPFRLRIDGRDPLAITSEEITFEGANTSLQIHLRVSPERFARTYNAAQLTTPLVVAAAANSPLFLGHELWDETRVALFKQAVDDRAERNGRWHPPARVSFGHGWVRSGALELFRESVALFPPVLPILDGEDPIACLEAGGTPALAELRLHHGTVWRWNRAVYDHTQGGHLRIEMRALPSGPTVVDMSANMAFAVGLALGLADETDWLLPSLPFEAAHRNFYRAAQHGLEGRLLWASRSAPSPVELPVRELIRTHLPTARRGLEASGVDPDEAGALLDMIAERCESGQNGARWQRETLAALESRCDRDTALHELTLRYQRHSQSGVPVHLWPVDGPA